MATLLSKPTLAGTIQESPLFQVLNTGLTDSIMLIGHADAAVMYEPYRVVNIQQAVNFLQADMNSPLLRALLEAYNGGCKDIWLYAAAPMEEYVLPNEDRLYTAITEEGALTPGDDVFPGDDLYPTSGYNFYQKYYQRLEAAYANLVDWDYNEIVIPVEAVFYDSGNVDFLTQLTDFCSQSFQVTGTVSIGVLGTRILNMNQAAVDAMINDARLHNLGPNGKFVLVTVGEGLVSHPQMSITYSASLSTQIGALLAAGDLSRSVAGLRLPGVSAVVGLDLTEAQISAMTEVKLNPVVRSKKGKRGLAFQAKMVTDNTLGQDGSDFWSMCQMHITAVVINQVKRIARSYIGEIYFDKFKQSIYDYLQKLRVNDYIRDFQLDIERLENGAKAKVSIGISPIVGIRNIYFTTIVGPGA